MADRKISHDEAETCLKLIAIGDEASYKGLQAYIKQQRDAEDAATEIAELLGKICFGSLADIIISVRKAGKLLTNLKES